MTSSSARSDDGRRGARITVGDDVWPVQVGEAADVGRAAPIPLGVHDPFLHGVVWRLTPWDDHWALDIPLTTRLEVHVVIGRIRRFVGVAGDRWTSDAPRAVITVTTIEQRHDVEVRWSRSAPIDPDDDGYVAPAASTIDLVTGLDLGLARHRAMVVACLDRVVDRYHVGASSNEAVAARLGLTVAAVKRRVDRAVHDVRSWHQAGGQPFDEAGDFFDRHAAVDWLVATGQVTQVLIDQAITAEAQQGR
jgi:hypothetical protein